MRRISIDDPSDPRLAVFLGLRDQEARKLREQSGGDMASYFIAEGDVVIERAIRAGCRVRSVLVAAARTKPLPDTLPDDADVFAADDRVLTEVTGRPELRDPIACFERPPLPDATALVEEHSTFAVLEGVNNPNNLGVVMRNAAALGVGAVLLDPTCGDPLYRRAIRASMGQVFVLPHGRLSDLSTGLSRLHDAGVTSVALTPGAELTLGDLGPELASASKVAILLGAEGPGLSDAALDAATHRARIAMHRDVDSLNVAAAAAIAFHEVDRFRQ